MRPDKKTNKFERGVKHIRLSRCSYFGCVNYAAGWDSSSRMKRRVASWSLAIKKLVWLFGLGGHRKMPAFFMGGTLTGERGNASNNYAGSDGPPERCSAQEASLPAKAIFARSAVVDFPGTMGTRMIFPPASSTIRRSSASSVSRV